MAELLYYKKNVPYTIGGRFFPNDAQGFTLTDVNPYVAVDKEKLRDFKIANRRGLTEGLIVPADEPDLDWETHNSVTDEQALELVKGNFLTLKKALEKIDSLSVVVKMLDLAKDNDRPKKTISAIQARVEELSDTSDEFIAPAEMRGVFNG